MAAFPGTKRQASASVRPAVKRRRTVDNVKGATRVAVKDGKPGRGSRKGSLAQSKKPVRIQGKADGGNPGAKRKFIKGSDAGTGKEKGAGCSKAKQFDKKELSNVRGSAPKWSKASAADGSKSDSAGKSLQDRKARKELTEARKKRRRVHYDLEKEVVAIWEKMRARHTSKEERRQFASEALGMMKGKMVALALGHITSRVLQCCVKYCSNEERTAVYEELRPHCLTLARNTYAYHLVTKMFDHATKDQTEQMIAQLHGQVVALLRHPSGSAVVEHAFNLGNKTQKQELLSEFYSPEYRLFKGILISGSGRIADVLKAEPSKRNTVLQHMTLSLQPILEKGIVDHSIVHRAVLEYFSIASRRLAEDVGQQLAGPLLVRMIHTKDGAEVAVICVMRGNTKDRKKIVKGLKGHVGKIAREEYGHVLLLAILEVVDDTTLVSKFVIKELVKELKDLALDKYGRRVLLQLLAPGVPRYFPPNVLGLLQAPRESDQALQGSVSGTSVEVEKGADAEMKDVDEVKQDVRKNDAANGNQDEDEFEEGGQDRGAGISKKDPEVRRKELLVDSGLAKSLTQTCIEHAGELMRSPLGTDVLYEVAMAGLDGMLWSPLGGQLSDLHQAIANLAAVSEDAQATGEESEEEHVLVQYHASRTLRRLVLNAKPPPEGTKAPSFAKTLWSIALQGRAKKWAQGYGARVVSAFQNCADPPAQDAAKLELQKLVDAGNLPARGAAPSRNK